MANINRVIISGRLTRDPELRNTPSGTSVLAMGIAVNDRRRNQQTGQWEDYTNFVDCTMFGNRCESLSHILTKGMLVVIEGRLRYSSWERDGQKRSKLEVIVDEIELPGRPQGSQAGQGMDGGYASAPSMGYASQPMSQPMPQQSYQQTYQQPAPTYAAPVQQPPMDQMYDEEIPF